MFTAEHAVLYPTLWISWWSLNLLITYLFASRYKLNSHQVQLWVRVIAYTLIPLLILIGTLMDINRPLSSADLNLVESTAVALMVCYFFYDISCYAVHDKPQTPSDLVHHWFLAYAFFLGFENHRLERGLLLTMLIMIESPPWSLSLIVREVADSASLHRLQQRYQFLVVNQVIYVLAKFVYFPFLSVYFLYRHLRDFPHLSVEDGFYVVGVPVINGLNVLWYNQRVTMIEKVRKRCEDAQAAAQGRVSAGKGREGNGRAPTAGKVD